MKTTTRRLAALAAAPLLAGVLVAAPGSAQAAPNANASSASYWLVNQLTDGLAVYDYEYEGETYTTTDVGLTIDVLQALVDSGTQTAKQATIATALEGKVGSYTSAGGTGKLITAISGAGKNPRSFGGVDLVARVEGKVVDGGDEAGRAVDSPDYSNTQTQALVVRALADEDSPKVASTLGYLLKQQCADGGFRSAMFTEAVADDPEDPYDYAIDAVDRQCGDSTTSGDDDETIDATSFAVQALIAARAQGASVQSQLSKAVRYLLDEQGADGGFENDGSANANSTGLAAAALDTYGKADAAHAGAAWLLKRQATKAVATGNKLADDLGAIAFDDDVLANGKADGIESLDLGQWIRSTSQAVAGINAYYPAATLKVTPKYAARKQAAQQLVTVSGLRAGEKVTVYAVSKTFTGQANASGTYSVRFAVGSSTGKKGVTVYGQRTVRQGASSFTVVK